SISMKKKYLLFIFLFLVALVIGYHLYAASQAEKQITQLIKQQTAQRGDISVQYSDIEVTPFTGKFIISDLTIIFGNHIERTKEITVDLAYLDVLNFYLSGTEYALKHLYEAEALLLKPSYINKANFHQLSSDSLHLHLAGRRWMPSGARSVIRPSATINRFRLVDPI